MNIQAPRDFIDRRQLVGALRALRRGDFSVRLPEEVDGVDGEIASLFNEVVSLNEEMTQEFERLSRIAQHAATLIRDPLLPQSPQQGRAYREISALFATPA